MYDQTDIRGKRGIYIKYLHWISNDFNCYGCHEVVEKNNFQCLNSPLHENRPFKHYVLNLHSSFSQNINN